MEETEQEIKIQNLELEIEEIRKENKELLSDKEKLQAHNQQLFLKASIKPEETETEETEETEMSFDVKNYFDGRRKTWRI